MISDEGQPNTGARAEQELRQVNEEWAKALAQRDRAALERIIADDFVLAYPFDGDDKSQFIDYVIRGDLTIGALESREENLRVLDQIGVVFGSETAHWLYRGRDLTGPYRFVRVYTWRDGRWQMIILHVCSLAHHQ
ncbi:MAG TPA: nuclear transport factor 2 family protein [Pyrinomonadaceae bacterium]|nr:nuclear transport factor 2 family protein [Pyrinomonadaceae bacterium]